MKKVWEANILRSRLYEFLSQAFLYPKEGQLDVLREETAALATECADRHATKLMAACNAVHEAIMSATNESLLDDYLSVFGHGVSKDCPQYACEYQESHIFMKSNTLSDLATFYKAFGVVLDPDLHDRLDHISVELEFLRLLVYKEAYALVNGHGDDKARLCRDAQRSFLTHHIADWSKSFVHKLRRKAKADSLFGLYAALLNVHLTREFEIFNIRPTPFSLTLVPDPAEEGEDCDSCPMAIGPA